MLPLLMPKLECKSLIRLLSLPYPRHLIHYQVNPDSIPQTSCVWPSPSCMLLLSRLRPSSFLTQTAAWASHSSPFLQLLLLLLKSTLFITVREDFSHLHIQSYRYPATDVSGSFVIHFIIYLIKAQNSNMVFIILPLPAYRATSPPMHAPRSGPNLHNFL